MKQYDAIIIGFGKGGKLLADALSKRKWKVAIVERSPQMYGGTCVNAGGIPTNFLLYEAAHVRKLHPDDFQVCSKLYSHALARKDEQTAFLRRKNREFIDNNGHITLYDGTASFLDKDTVQVESSEGKTVLRAKEIFIDTGSVPIHPDIRGIDESKKVFDSATMLHNPRLPAHLLILGAGCIGLEFATLYAGFGSRVTLLEAERRFMQGMDRDISECMLESLARQRIGVQTGIDAQSVHDTPRGITLTYRNRDDGTSTFIEGDALLLAAGRRPMTDELALYRAGVETDICGAIIVDEHLHTSTPHVWALGDVVRQRNEQCGYLAADDCRIILNQLFGDRQRSLADRSPIPHAVFTNPPLAHIGLGEEEAKKKGYAIHVTRLPAAAILCASTLQNRDGMMKAVVDAHTGRILGCTLFCLQAAEVIHIVTMAVKEGKTYDSLRDFLFLHPSMGEGLNELFRSI